MARLRRQALRNSTKRQMARSGLLLLILMMILDYGLHGGFMLPRC
jgi:hypothetical protein